MSLNVRLDRGTGRPARSPSARRHRDPVGRDRRGFFDRDMFLGHSIIVSMDAKVRPTDATIAG
jgi:hypothetical protein